MPAYHSSFINNIELQIAGFAILPLKTKFRGPSQIVSDSSSQDIVDECIQLFRANCFFKNFEIKGSADRTLIYGILFISDCLNKLSRANCTKNDSIKLLNTFALENFTIPGDAGFPFNSLYPAPSNQSDSDFLRQYIAQFRQELALRLINHVYDHSDDKPNKWWLCFSKRKFMNKTLS